MAAIPDSIDRSVARVAAFIPVVTSRFCRAHKEGGVYTVSKYRFCVPQNRRTSRKAAGHGSGKEVAR